MLPDFVTSTSPGSTFERPSSLVFTTAADALNAIVAVVRPSKVRVKVPPVAVIVTVCCSSVAVPVHSLTR